VKSALKRKDIDSILAQMNKHDDGHQLDFTPRTIPVDDNDSQAFLSVCRSDESLACMYMLYTDIHEPAYNPILSISPASSESPPTNDARNISSTPSVAADNLNQLSDHGQSQARRCSGVPDRHLLLSPSREDRIAKSEPYHVCA